MFKKLAFLALIVFHTSASATLILNLDGESINLLTAVLDTDDNELRVNTGVALICTGGTPPTSDSITLVFEQINMISFSLESTEIERVLDNTEINATSPFIGDPIVCVPDPGEDIFFVTGFEDP